MVTKRFSNQTAEQVASHLKASLDSERFNIKIDTFAGIAEIRKSSSGKKGHSKKREKIRGQMADMTQKKRRKVLSAKRREKPKLKHVRNGRMITLKGYTAH